MKLFFKKINKLNKGLIRKSMTAGFTFVETLVALSIFTLAVLTMLVVLSNGISDANYVERKLIGSYLAQEGVEYVRNMRDTYMLYYVSTPQEVWDAFNTKIAGGVYLSSGACASTHGCYFSDLSAGNFGDNAQPITKLTVTACADSTCSNAPLLYDSLTGKYNYTTGVDSGFRRRIKVTQINANEVKIESGVFWTLPSGSQSIISSETLFNWI